MLLTPSSNLSERDLGKQWGALFRSCFGKGKQMSHLIGYFSCTDSFIKIILVIFMKVGFFPLVDAGQQSL